MMEQNILFKPIGNTKEKDHDIHGLGIFQSLISFCSQVSCFVLFLVLQDRISL